MENLREPTYSLLSKPLSKCVLEDPVAPPPSQDMLHAALEPLRAWITESVTASNRKITLSAAELIDKLRQSSRENLDRLEDDPERAIRAEFGFLQFIEKVLTSPPTTIGVLAQTLDEPLERIKEWISETPRSTQVDQVGRMLLDYLRDLCAEPEPPSTKLPPKPLAQFEDLEYLGNLKKAFGTLYEANPPKPAQAEYIPDVVKWVHQRQENEINSDLLLVAPTNGGKNGIILAAALAAIAHDRGPVIVLQPYRAQISESRRSWQDAVAGRPVRRRGVTRGVEIAGSSAMISNSDYRISRGRVDITAIIPEKLAVLTRSRRLKDFCRLLIVDEIAHLIDPERGGKLEILLTLAKASEIPLFATGAGLAAETAESVARWLGNLASPQDPRSTSCLLHNPALRREPPLEYCVWRRDGERRFWRHGSSLADQQTDRTDTIDTTIIEDAVADVVYRELKADPTRQILVFLEDREGVLQIADSVASRLRSDTALANQLALIAQDSQSEPLSEIWLGGTLLSRIDIPMLLQHRVGIHTRDVPSNNVESIERNFREGRLRVLCATRTVEAGINLPVDTVVQVGLLDHSQRPLPQRTLDQRLGRSGRTIRGHQTPGRGIIYIHEPTHGIERVIPTRLLQEDPATGSQMNEEYLALLLLTSIGAVGEKPEKREEELQALIRQSYWAKERADHVIQSTFRSALTSLQQKGLIDTNDEGLISATPLGQALASALLTPQDAFGVQRIREVAESTQSNESWLAEVLFAACQVPTIANSKRRPREQDVIVRSPLSRSQVLKAWCRQRADGRLEFGVPGKGTFSMVAGTQLEKSIGRIIKESAAPAELKALLRAYIATAWTLGLPVEFPRYISSLNEYIVGQDLGYYLAHVVRAAAWLAHYEGRFLLNLRLLELSQQVELGVRVEALPFMEVCGDHVSRGDIRKESDLDFEKSFDALPQKLADDLRERMDFLRRRKRDREERLALDDNVFSSREDLVSLQRAEQVSDMTRSFTSAWQGQDDQIIIIDSRTLEIAGTRIHFGSEIGALDEIRDTHLIVTTRRLELPLQRSRDRQPATILGSEEFLVFFSLFSAFPVGQQVLFLTTVARLQRVAHREILRALYAEISGSGRFSEFEQGVPTVLTVNTAVSRLLRDLQLLYSGLLSHPTTNIQTIDVATENSIRHLRDRLMNGANEILTNIRPLIQQRMLIKNDAENRKVPVPNDIQDALLNYLQQEARVRELKKEAGESKDYGQLERLELELIQLFEKF